MWLSLQPIQSPMRMNQKWTAKENFKSKESIPHEFKKSLLSRPDFHKMELTVSDAGGFEGLLF